MPVAARADSFLYIALAGEDKIVVYRQDPDDGKFIRTSAGATALPPNALAVVPAGPSPTGPTRTP